MQPLPLVRRSTFLHCSSTLERLTSDKTVAIACNSFFMSVSRFLFRCCLRR